MVTALTAARLVAGFLLLLGNGFFVTTEFAMTRVRQFPEEEFTGRPGLERAWEMTERLEISLSGCQVGITMCSVGLGVVAEPAVTAVVDPLFRTLGFAAGAEGHTAVSVFVAFAVINLMHVVVGEQAPTYLGVERSRWVAAHGSRALYWWTKLLYPVIAVADWIVKWLLSLFGVTISRSWAKEKREWKRSWRDARRPAERSERRWASSSRGWASRTTGARRSSPRSTSGRWRPET